MNMNISVQKVIQLLNPATDGVCVNFNMVNKRM